MDDRLRRCAIHGPEMAAYVRELVERERNDVLPAWFNPDRAISIDQALYESGPQDAATIVTDDDEEA